MSEHRASRLREPEHPEALSCLVRAARGGILAIEAVGGFRAPTVLNKPFAEVAEEIGLGHTFTQRGMRRTFNDLARRAKIESIVTRSISGHLTERMQDHYSTVGSEEQRESIAKVVQLFGERASTRATSTGGAPGGAPGAEVVRRTRKPVEG